MWFRFFIRRAADSDRRARTGSLRHVYVVMERGGEREECMCVLSHLFCGSHIEIFLSAIIQLWTHTGPLCTAVLLGSSLFLMFPT